ncbi:MAG: NAD-dependent epimerase/dehydratase family protein [Bifidobacterium mongoliense]|jgi:UDP-glucuronate decarboxylase|uniref:NAD-dependent epimerase/dehydratase family protein n=1 Tax=Bifidobacterium mongoliense TaxID=518643 RepID=UPI002F35C735
MSKDDRLSSALYQEDLRYCAGLPLPWSSLENATVMISGATGMIGTFLIDVLRYKRLVDGLFCHVVALGRSGNRARVRFPYIDEPWFSFERVDISVPDALPVHDADITVHLASVTNPLGYATDPIGTITSNIMGLRNLLEHQSRCSDSISTNNFVFASSVEIYGQSRGDQRPFDESYCGYIDCNTVRAGYPEAKRLGEALCQAYLSQRGVRPVIARIARAYGPTLHSDDSKALSQFLHRGIERNDIVLKSSGEQFFSYLYVADVVGGLLYCLFRGEKGAAYNLADAHSDVRLRDLALDIAGICGVTVKFEQPDMVEQSGYSKANYAVMDASKLRNLGWSAHYPLHEGLGRTIRILS